MRKALKFSIAVCLFSWAVFGIFYAACGGDVKSRQVLFTLFCTLYMFFPMLVAMFLQWRNGEKFSSTGLLNFRPKWSWLWASVIPVLCAILVTLFSALVPGVRLEYSPDGLISMFGMEGASADALRSQFETLSPWLVIGGGLASGIIAGCTVNAVAAFGEEYGWRNYMVAAFRGRKFMTAALVIGAVWGIWHAPLILMGHNYPQHPVAGVPMMVVFCILLGFIELYLVRKTGSVVPAAIFHGTFNALAGFSLYFVQGGNDLTVGSTGVAGFALLALVCIVIFLYDRLVSKDGIITSEL